MTEPDTLTTLGILGAGRAGTALARVAASCGLDVDIAASRTPAQLKYHLAQYAPRARAIDAEDIGERAQIVVLMVPQEDLDDVDPPSLAGTILVDATNRWQQEPVPRWLQAHLDEGMSSSEAIAAHFSTARVVKALNHLSHWDLDAPDRATASPRRGLLVASDDDPAAALVAALVSRLGYDPVHVPRLHKGRIAEPGGPLFNRPMTAAQIREVL
ncbi:MAG: NADPH-dependent F420 reductase [Micrococcaceae bacterium]